MGGNGNEFNTLLSLYWGKSRHVIALVKAETTPSIDIYFNVVKFHISVVLFYLRILLAYHIMEYYLIKNSIDLMRNLFNLCVLIFFSKELSVR